MRIDELPQLLIGLRIGGRPGDQVRHFLVGAALALQRQNLRQLLQVILDVRRHPAHLPDRKGLVRVTLQGASQRLPRLRPMVVHLAVEPGEQRAVRRRQFAKQLMVVVAERELPKRS